MRILATADIHGVLSVYEWLVELVVEYEVDLLLIAGDLFAGDWEEGQREQARQIIPALKRVAAPCFYIMGNDDNVALDYEDERIKPLMEGSSLVEFTTSSLSIHTAIIRSNLFVKSEEQIGEDLQSLEPLLEKSTILVTHAPAYGFWTVPMAMNTLAAGHNALLQRRQVLVHPRAHS